MPKKAIFQFNIDDFKTFLAEKPRTYEEIIQRFKISSKSKFYSIIDILSDQLNIYEGMEIVEENKNQNKHKHVICYGILA